jgi:hypothetical protein
VTEKAKAVTVEVRRLDGSVIDTNCASTLPDTGTLDAFRVAWRVSDERRSLFCVLHREGRKTAVHAIFSPSRSTVT